MFSIDRWSRLALGAAIPLALGVAVLGGASRLDAQDHSAHAGHAMQQPAAPRPLGGEFRLDALNGIALPTADPRDRRSVVASGTLVLRLARPDSGRFVLSLVTKSPACCSSGLSGAVRVLGDSLIVTPDSADPAGAYRFAHRWTPARALELTDRETNVWRFVATGSDTAFAGVQSRGTGVMGVDQDSSTHVFESLPDGGRIVLQSDRASGDAEATIRAHLRDIAARFGRGDFTLRGQVHGMAEVPGTKVMAARRRAIRYVAEPLPRGGQVRIITTDPEAVKAVHEFLAFQRIDHRAAGHDHR